ncbi:MAG: complex I NDUFA9 subunit family protein [Rhizobiales bacterium]|nr:complex I NDUFA9 subunit family protein [Hyphomicrobiales bacterium]
MKNASDKIVTIIGGSGFIGRYVTRRLAKAGFRVRVAVRRPDLAGYLQPSGGVGQVFPIQGNVRFPKSIEAAVKGADYVINLAGITDQRGKQKFDIVNAQGAKTVAELAAKHGVEKLIHFSTLNAEPKNDEDDADTFLTSNYSGEENVKAAFPTAIIVRPSVVFGPEDRLFNIIARFAKLGRYVAPIFSDLEKSFEPVYVDDIAKAMVALIDSEYAGVTFELGGPRKMTMADIVNKTLSACNRDAKIIAVPSILANIFSSICTMLPYSWVTRGEVELWSRDNVVSDAAKAAGHTLEGLGIKPTNCDEAILPYLQHNRPDGDYGLHAIKTPELETKN